jgi:hypothetical protein
MMSCGRILPFVLFAQCRAHKALQEDSADEEWFIINLVYIIVLAGLCTLAVVTCLSSDSYSDPPMPRRDEPDRVIKVQIVGGDLGEHHGGKHSRK